MSHEKCFPRFFKHCRSDGDPYGESIKTRDCFGTTFLSHENKDRGFKGILSWGYILSCCYCQMRGENKLGGRVNDFYILLTLFDIKMGT